MTRLIVGITGASGVIYGIRFLEVLRELHIESHLIISSWGLKNIEIETNYQPRAVLDLADYVYDISDMSASPSSGSFKHDGMVIIPCSMKTLSALANGYTANLIVRSGDVALKEGRKLVVVPRETPLNMIHLENMLKLAKAGAVIAPPVPAMYACPATVDDIINNSIGRILDRFGVEHVLFCWD